MSDEALIWEAYSGYSDLRVKRQELESLLSAADADRIKYLEELKSLQANNTHNQNDAQITELRHKLNAAFELMDALETKLLKYPVK